MFSFVVNLHGAEGAGGEFAVRNVTAECRLNAVGVQVFTQIDQILTAVDTKHSEGVLREQLRGLAFHLAAGFPRDVPVLAVLTAVGLLVTVAKFDMVAE